jgi:hypothetical protein
MNEVPIGLVRVRLASHPDWQPFAEFWLSETDLAGRVQREDAGTRSGTVAYMAAETAWNITQLPADEALQEARDGRVPYEYAIQAMNFQRAGGPSMGVGEYAEVVRATGARSVWRCADAGWDLAERQPANAIAKERADRDAGKTGGSDVEAEAER